MKAAEMETIAIVGVVGMIAFLLWKASSAAVKAVGSAVDSATTGIGNAYIALTGAPPPSLLGNVVFADGSYLPMAQIQSNWVGNSLQFTYMGTTYELGPHDAAGNYPATPIGASNWGVIGGW